jgi:transcriptional regulator with XRE-family HTH domain
MPRGLIEINGEALRAERERVGLSVIDVGRRTGIAPESLSRIENGPPKHVRPATLRNLAKAIGIEPSVLTRGGGG